MFNFRLGRFSFRVQRVTTGHTGLNFYCKSSGVLIERSVKIN